ncbi:AIP3-domain-containing protein [Clavulina sp. PMI_390]|nr:AIP3-domain-containing protein [Clavulina sp. PMI_390]
MSTRENSRSSRNQPAVDSIVTRLLVAIKQLLEALQLWSTGVMSDVDVSNVYVQLGNEFNQAVTAFNSYRIDMTDLEDIPQSLREVLENALSNDASPAVLDIYLPQVRAIITTLLTGLRSKQDAYKEAAAQRAERRAQQKASGARDRQSTSSSGSRPERSRPSGGRERESRRSGSGTHYPDGEPVPARRPSEAASSVSSEDHLPSRYSSRASSGPRPTPRGTPAVLPTPIPEEEPPQTADGLSNGTPTPRASVPPDYAQSPTRGPGPGNGPPFPVPRRTALMDEARADGPQPPPSDSERLASRASAPPSKSPLTSAKTLPSSRGTESMPPPAMRRGQSAQAQPTRNSIADDNQTPQSTAPPESDPPPMPSPPIQQAIPASVKRWSLSDNPVPQLPKLQLESGSPTRPDSVKEEQEGEAPPTTSIYSVHTDGSGDIPPTPSASSDGAVMDVPEAQLGDLKSSQQLERRASKRYSTYTFAKLTSSTSVSDRPNRKSMLAPDSLITPRDLDVVAEEEDGDTGSTTPANFSPSASRRYLGGARDKAYTDLTRKGSRSRRSPSTSPLPPIPALPSRDASPIRNGPATSTSEIPPPPPPAETKPNGSPLEASAAVEKPPATEAAAPSHPTPPAPPAPHSDELVVFLQVGRQVQKVKLKPDDLSFASLRVLFVNKFSYNPGSSNFPDIYIKDPSSGVQYLLEDVDEVQSHCLLSLNIEPLDQIKQQFDTQMTSLHQEMKELKATILSTRRHSVNITSSPQMPPPPPEAVAERPTDKQFQNAAKRLTRVMTRPDLAFARDGLTNGTSETAAPPMPSVAQPLVPQMTGNSLVSDERAVRMVADLKTQFDEIQALRRDMGVMRQIYTDFVNTTRETLTSVRTQAHKVRELANAKVGGARAYINTGKANLDSRSQGILTKMDDLGDAIEGIRDDVIKRRRKPTAAVLKSLSADIQAAEKELESLTEMIATVKPTWKQTWEQELQNILDEQQFLTHQEELIKDLVEDRKDLTAVFQQLQEVAAHRGGTRGRPPAFRPPAPEEGHEGLSTVMLEIRGAQVDPQRRLAAIEENQRMRERERAARGDEFQDELKDFVDGKKLKMIGGAEEAERVRQHRNDLTLRAMFQPTAPLQYSK